MSKIMNMNGSMLQDAINKSQSISEVLMNLGFLPHVTYYTEIRERCQALGLELPQFSRTGQSIKPLSKVMVENSSYHRGSLRRRLLSEEVLLEKCAECGLEDTWNGRKIVLQLDHINGINNDHRLENLRFLCPNCHSQTNTWCGRGNRSDNHEPTPPQPKKQYSYKDLCECGNMKGKNAKYCRRCNGINKHQVEWPDYESLQTMLSESNYVQVGKLLGCTDNAIRKHMRKIEADRGLS